MIYAVGITGGKYIKIGYTDGDIEKRVAALQTGCPYRLEVFVTVEGTLKQEQTLHHQLRRSFGRMFLPTPPNEWYPGRHGFFKGFLEELQYGFDAALGYLMQHDPTCRRDSPKFDEHDYSPIFKWPKNP